MHSDSSIEARIANGSWSTMYRSYPLSCRLFDEALPIYDNNQGMGLVKMDSSLSIPGKNNLYALVRNNVEINNGGDHGKIIKATPLICELDPYKHDLS